MYKTEEYGLFLGFMTMPFGKEEEFIKYEVDNLFKQYKEEIEKFADEDDPNLSSFKSYFYFPKAYCLFGKFDLALFSLIDNFDLGTKEFHPFSPLIQPKLQEAKEKEEVESYEPVNYTYHTISGLAPDLKFISKDEDSLLEKAQKTFLQEKGKGLPLIGITSLKFNNGFMIGNSGAFPELLLRKIREVILEPTELEGKLEYLIIHTFSWHEITIVFFSDSYSRITDRIFTLRELTFSDLYDGRKARSKVIDKMLNKSLMGQFLKFTNNEKGRQKIKTSHLFVHSHTTFGYDIDYLTEEMLVPPALNEGLSIYLRWRVKPGHLKSFIKAMEEVLQKCSIPSDQLGGQMTAGHIDYAQMIHTNALDNYLKIVKETIDSEAIKHVRKIDSVPVIDGKFPEDYEGYFKIDEHYFFHDEIQQFRFTLNQIDSIKKCLLQLRVSEIVSLKIINMYSIYNDGIHDPILYGYFIELKPFLKAVILIIEGFLQDKTAVIDVSEVLDQIVNRFEAAYKNRFSQSYIMNEITDFNIEFNGGIQQLTSLYDSAYKSLTRLLGERNHPLSFVYVAGFTNIKSDISSLQLNYFHLYQPEFFAAAATHEAANFFFDRDGYPPQTWDLDALEELQAYLDDLLEEPDDETFEKPDVEPLKFIFQDLVAFCLTYAEDFALFFYWHWASFIQTSIVYNQDGSLNQKAFNHFLSRMMLVALMNDEMDFFKDKAMPYRKSYDASLSKAWEEAILIAESLAEQLLIHHGDFLWRIFRLTQFFAVFELVENFSENESALKNIRKEILKDSSKECLETVERYFDFSPQDNISGANNYRFIRFARKNLLKAYAKGITKSFKKGRIHNLEKIASRPLHKYTQQSFFYHSLFYAYLSIIKELSGDEPILLVRDSEGKINVSRVKENPFVSFRFDPYGGTFASDLSVRQQYFKYRVLFLKTMWLLSIKNKVNLFGLNRD